MKRRGMWRSALMATAAVTALALPAVSGLGRAIAATTSSAKPTLSFAVKEAATTGLSPAQSGVIPWIIDDLAYLPLIQLDPQGNYQPGLATSWQFSNENKTFEMTLRNGVHFSDGSLLTPSVVVQWFNFYQKHAQGNAADLNIATVDATGPSTVVMHLKAPTPDMLYLLSEEAGAGMVTSPKAMANPAELAYGTDGTGPYVNVPSSSIANSQYTFVPNKNYYDPAAIHWGKVIVYVMTNPNSTLEALSSGQIEVAEGDITTANSAKAAGLHVIAHPWGFEGVVFMDRGATAPGGAKNPLTNVLVRQAMNYAINRKEITTAVFGQYGAPTSEIPTRDGWVPADQNYYSYDPQKAKKLLAEAGYPNGFSLNVLDQNYTGTDPMLEAVAQQEGAVGIKFNIAPGPDPAEWVSSFYSKHYSVGGIIYTIFFSSDTLYSCWLEPGGGCTFGGGDDPVLDGYAKAAEELPPNKAVADWQKVWNRVVTQGDELPVSEVDGFYYVDNKVGGVAFSGASGTADPTYWHPL